MQQAVEEFSLYLPGQATADLAVSSGAREVSLATLTRPVRVEAVEYPVGQWPRALLDFSVWGTTLTLDHAPPAAGYTVRVYYGQQHLVDGSGSSVPAAHENLVVEGGAALAILARAMGAANTAETASTPPYTFQHLRVAQERLERWRTLLRTFAGRMQQRGLYVAAPAPVSRHLVRLPG